MSFYSKIIVQGTDAEKFLQGQITCDVRKASTDQPLLGAHCNPKGRIVSLFFLLKAEGGFALYLPQDLLEIAYNNFKKYGQFFKQLILEKIESIGWLPPFVKNLDPNVRWDDNQHIKRLHIETGIPLIYTATSGLFLPHDINLPQLNGVSFDKGCYTGQEIIARMQNLGKPKQHLYSLVIARSVTTKQSRSENSSPLGTDLDCFANARNDGDIFKPGTKIYLPERLDSEIGYIVDAAYKENTIIALASLKDAALQSCLKTSCQKNIEITIENSLCVAVFQACA